MKGMLKRQCIRLYFLDHIKRLTTFIKPKSCPMLLMMYKKPLSKKCLIRLYLNKSFNRSKKPVSRSNNLSRRWLTRCRHRMRSLFSRQTLLMLRTTLSIKQTQINRSPNNNQFQNLNAFRINRPSPRKSSANLLKLNK